MQQSEYETESISEESSVDNVQTEPASEESSESNSEMMTEESSEPSSSESSEDVSEESSTSSNDTVSNNSIDSLVQSNEEILGMLKASQESPLTVSDNSLVYSDYETFVSSTAVVDRYQYEILNKLEFIQYALLIVIALLFLSLFRRK